MYTYRIARQTEVPSPFRDSDYHNAAKLPRIGLDDELYLEYSVSAPSIVGDVDPNPDEAIGMLRRQECTAWVFLNGRSVGGAILKRYMIPPLMGNDEFLDLMDMDSSAEQEMSVAIDSRFGDIVEEVGVYGDVLLLDRIWLARTPFLTGRSTEVVNALVSAFCPEFAMIILKAFPLEYESKLSEDHEDSGREEVFRRRRKAMMRLYQREFGVVPLNATYGERGWMYRVRSDLVGIID